MIVDIPFLYTIEVVPPRCRNSVSHDILDSFPLELREETAEALPVAFRVVEGRDIPIVDKDGSVARVLNNPTEIRWDAKHGQLFAPATLRYDETMEPLGVAEIQARLTAMSKTPFAGVQGIQWGSDIRRKGVALALIEGRVVSSNRRERVADIIERNRDVVLVDGLFMGPTTEPIWKVEGDRRYPRVEAEYATPYKMKDRAVTNLFRADRLDDALNAATVESTAAWGDGTADVEQRGVIEVLIPEAVRLPLDDLALICELRAHVNDENVQRGLAKGDVAGFVAYAGVRDALPACEEAGRIDEHLFAAAHKLIETMAAQNEDSRDWRHKWLETAWNRVHADRVRALPADFGEGLVLPPPH